MGQHCLILIGSMTVNIFLEQAVGPIGPLVHRQRNALVFLIQGPGQRTILYNAIYEIWDIFLTIYVWTNQF